MGHALKSLLHVGHFTVCNGIAISGISVHNEYTDLEVDSNAYYNLEE